jgi:hypothetical protein
MIFNRSANRRLPARFKHRREHYAAPSPFLGRTIGADLPAWNITKWANTARPVPLSSLRGQSHSSKRSHRLFALPGSRAVSGVALQALSARAVGKWSRFRRPLVRRQPRSQLATVQAWVKERGLTIPSASTKMANGFRRDERSKLPDDVVV